MIKIGSNISFFEQFLLIYVTKFQFFVTKFPFFVAKILIFYDPPCTWRKWKQRAPKWTEDYSDMRKLFANLIKKIESKEFNMIYVDEASVCPQNITFYSWWHKHKSDPIIRPSIRINMIAAIILPHKYAFMLKTGSIKSEHMIFFFELLHAKLWDWFGWVIHKIDYHCIW